MTCDLAQRRRPFIPAAGLGATTRLRRCRRWRGYAVAMASETTRRHAASLGAEILHSKSSLPSFPFAGRRSGRAKKLLESVARVSTPRRYANLVARRRWRRPHATAGLMERPAPEKSESETSSPCAPAAARRRRGAGTAIPCPPPADSGSTGLRGRHADVSRRRATAGVFASSLSEWSCPAP